MDDKRGGDKPLHLKVWGEYEKGQRFNDQMNINDTVEANENFFIGKQWEGVEANGLPTPVFNFLKRVTLFQVASITTDNIKMQSSPLRSGEELAEVTRIVNREFDDLFEHNKIGMLLREYMRNAAVDGDGCLYSYWDPDVPTGHPTPGAIRTEVVENTRVFFGNVNDRRVQRQPYIIISTYEMVDEVKRRAKENGAVGWQDIKPDTPDANANYPERLQDDKVTVLLRLRRDRKSGTIWGYECTRTGEVRGEWDMGLTLYPVTWLNWDYIQNSYHGQALITGLIPNQIFVNKLFAMAMISLMTTAYPRIVYDKTRVSRWDSRVGSAIGINGGDVNNVAKVIDPAAISPQISQFIELAVNYTQTFLGATSAAMGDTRPDNTSAIIALQRAAAIPSEITKQNLYQSIEDLGRIYMDFMAEYYGVRAVEGGPGQIMFDFDALRDIPMSIKLDVGASAYWSEIASMQTLDNLLMQDKIELVDYLERVPDGYISKKQELIDKINMVQQMAQAQGMPGMPGGGMPGAPPPMPGQIDIPEAAGFGALQRAVINEGQ